MTEDWNESDQLLASATRCPMPHCGALTISYRSAHVAQPAPLWEFTCPLCGVDFTAGEEDLVFQSVPKEWLQAEIHAA